VELSPYFKALARQKRICPRCHKAPLSIVPLELTWDGVTEKCEACGYMQAIFAPESARLGQREQVEEQPAESSGVDVFAEMARAHRVKAEQASAPRVIGFDEIRRRKDGR
jgi:transcription elongation factor Elf1